MRLNDVTDILNDLLPQNLVEEGDNCGLLIGHTDKEVDHIRVALEVTNKVLEKGIEDGVDMFVVHHPLLYMSLKQITNEDGIGDKVLKLIKNDIALYAAHSNLDRMKGGLNRRFASLIGLKDIEPCVCDSDGFILKGHLDTPRTLKAYSSMLAKVLGEPCLRYMGEGDKVIKTVAFCTGSGMDLLNNKLFDEADLYLTGDIKYHYAMEVIEMGNALIDITHYSSESMAADVLESLLDIPELKDIQISKDKQNINPINYSEVTV